MTKKIKLPRVAKGKKPRYLDDGSIDNLMAMIMTLTQEISVLRDRIDTFEQILEDKNVISEKSLMNSYRAMTLRPRERIGDISCSKEFCYQSKKILSNPWN